MSAVSKKFGCFAVCPKCWKKWAWLRTMPTRYISSASSSELNSEEHKPERYLADLSDGGRDRLHEGGALYPNHIPTTILQKTLLSVGAAAMAITSPWRGDMVATLGETTGHLALIRLQQKMLADPVGAEILREQPRINTQTIDMEYLQRLPEGTFGREYISWLELNHASPDERLPVQFVDDPELAYVMQRYREIHDLIHTICGMPTNMLGEIVVKWVEALQLGLPMCALGALFGPVRLGPKHRQKYIENHLWWAIRNGYKAKFLMNVYYEKHWDWPLEELRQELNIEPPPETPPRKFTS